MMMMVMMVMMLVVMIMQPMVGDFHVVASGHRETTGLKLIVIFVAEIQN